jgi:hypothetical protein
VPRPSLVVQYRFLFLQHPEHIARCREIWIVPILDEPASPGTRRAETGRYSLVLKLPNWLSLP